MTIKRIYNRLRAKGYNATDAMRNARIQSAFDRHDGKRVKLEWVPDDETATDWTPREDCAVHGRIVP